MKVCLYLEGQSLIGKSGFRTAFENHKAALRSAGVTITEDPLDDYELLHTHWFGPKSLRYARRALKLGIPLVCHAHSMGAHDFRDSFTFSNVLAPLYSRYLRYYYNHADAVFTCSRFAKRMLRKEGVTVPVFVVSNACDPGRIQYDEAKRSQFRSELGLEKFMFFSSGHLIPRKGVDDFLRVAAELEQYDFVWYGKLWRKALSMNSDIHRKLSNPPANMHLPGFIDDISAAYSAGDGLFFPSWTENQPMVVLECATIGLPLVVRDIPEYEGFLTDGVNCLLARSVEEFKEKLVAVAENEELRGRLKAGALELATEHDFSNVGRRLRELYEALIAEKKALMAVTAWR